MAAVMGNANGAVCPKGSSQPLSYQGDNAEYTFSQESEFLSPTEGQAASPVYLNGRARVSYKVNGSHLVLDFWEQSG